MRRNESVKEMVIDLAGSFLETRASYVRQLGGLMEMHSDQEASFESQLFQKKNEKN